MVQFLVNLSMHPASCKLMGVPMSVFTFTSGFLTWEPDRLCLGWNKQTAEQLWGWLPSSFWPYYVPSQLHLRWSPNETDLEANCPLCTLTCRPWLSTLLHLLTRTVGSSLSLLHSCACHVEDMSFPALSIILFHHLLLHLPSRTGDMVTAWFNNQFGGFKKVFVAAVHAVALCFLQKLQNVDTPRGTIKRNAAPWCVLSLWTPFLLGCSGVLDISKCPHWPLGVV